MNKTIEDRADAYLDGLLGTEEVRAFERELAQDSRAAKALNEALMLRELLQSAPGQSHPLDLERKVINALALPAAPVLRTAKNTPSRGTVGTVLAGFQWSVRSTAVVSGGSLDGARNVVSGLAQIRWMLGPLAMPRAERVEKPPKQPWWRRALALAGI